MHFYEHTVSVSPPWSLGPFTPIHMKILNTSAGQQRPAWTKALLRNLSLSSLGTSVSHLRSYIPAMDTPGSKALLPPRTPPPRPPEPHRSTLVELFLVCAQQTTPDGLGEAAAGAAFPSTRLAARPALLRKHAVPAATPGAHVKGSAGPGRAPCTPAAGGRCPDDLPRPGAGCTGQGMASPRPGAPSVPGGTPPALWLSSAAAALGNRSEEAGSGGPGAALAAQALVLLLIFLLSSLGNGAVVGAIVKHRPLRTVTNAFVLSLALSDLLIALLCLPAAFLDLLAPPGVPGLWRGFCAASRFFGSCGGIVSSLSVALISLDRYCAIARPPRDKLGRRRALQLLAGAWLAALGFSLPWELLLPAPRGPPAAAQSFHGCLYRTSPDPAQLGAAFSVALVVACYLLPFLLMCFCHFHICRAVRLCDVRVRPVTTHARALRFFREVRTATTVLLMIVFVIGCWGPHCLLVLLAAARQAQAGRAPSLLDVLAVWLTWANGAIHPLIYAIRNPNLSMLLGRSREEGYRTRNPGAFLAGQSPVLQLRSRSRFRNRCTGRLRACSRMASSDPASGAGGDLAMWARKNPVVLFCREGPAEPGTAVAKQPKSEVRDTSL
ncbi:probable G-protein coupled receptor 135 [Octodon degus]|uniref:Probable G-protein coupled receptor 135 n=1 Tax=Octodon degus TaxID=10160 RepID=A0A6P3ESG8_OCTDE|nr:probable G-protein coupled receptor 135 [Octodon degus]